MSTEISGAESSVKVGGNLDQLTTTGNIIALNAQDTKSGESQTPLDMIAEDIVKTDQPDAGVPEKAVELARKLSRI